MGLLIAPILFVAAIIYVAYPLLTDPVSVAPGEADEEKIGQLFEEKDEIVASLKDIDMDYRMGKLSLQDYNSLRSDFERRAADVFKRLEEAETATDEDR
jgi:hypothetical protein